MNIPQQDITRRGFFKTAGSAAASAALTFTMLGTIGATPAHAGRRTRRIDSHDYDFLIARVKFDCDRRVNDPWNVYPGADGNVLDAFSRTVRCKVKRPSGCSDIAPHMGDNSTFGAVVDLNDISSLRKYPFLFMTAEGSYTLSPRNKANLRQYLGAGGFLLMDDCVFHKGGDFFYRSSFRVLEDMFGSGSVRKIPNSHEVFHNVHDLSAVGLPHIQGQKHGARGVFIDDRLAVFLSATDIHCGWADRRGIFFARDRHVLSLKMGVNIIMYALSH